jgi:hypothetical protein
MRKLVVGSVAMLIAACCSVPLMAQVAQPSPSDGAAPATVVEMPMQDAAPVDASAPAVVSGDFGCCGGSAAPMMRGGYRMNRGSSCCDPCGHDSGRRWGGRSWGGGRNARRGSSCCY